MAVIEQSIGMHQYRHHRRLFLTAHGAQGKALQRYGQDYAGTKLDHSVNRLSSLANIGQNVEAIKNKFNSLNIMATAALATITAKQRDAVIELSCMIRRQSGRTEIVWQRYL